MRLDINQRAFLALVKAGLWEQDIQLSSFGNIDFRKVHKLAEEQSVVGLVAAGIEHVLDVKVPQEMALAFVGTTLQLERHNSAMNAFIAELLLQTTKAGIKWVLIKGQGVAQCYVRPKWRNAGDIDLLVDDANYTKAQRFFDIFTGHAVSEKNENSRKHLEYYLGSWLVELHGTVHTNLSKKIDDVVDKAQKKVFDDGEVRVWENGDASVFLPSPDNDVIFVFTHILQHFFRGGIGLRQLCDLSRLLWAYRNSINKSLLNQRLEQMGVMSEWMVFGCILVDILGLQKEAMPFYDDTYKRKANRVLSLIMEAGNFGHNYDYSYFTKYPALIRKVITVWKQSIMSSRHAAAFPLDSFRFYVSFLVNRTRRNMKSV